MSVWRIDMATDDTFGIAGFEVIIYALEFFSGFTKYVLNELAREGG